MHLVFRPWQTQIQFEKPIFELRLHYLKSKTCRQIFFTFLKAFN